MVSTRLKELVVPAAFARHDKLADTTVLTDLYRWKSNAEFLLNGLGPLNVSAFSISELADLVSVLTPLTAISQWSTPAMGTLASAHLAEIPVSDQLIAYILTHVVKPIFASAPHPRLHISTARILPRPADVQDTYVEQSWKEHPGIEEVIRWCLLNTESSAYERAWPLFLPPVMSFLDDYQVPYKLLGIQLVSDMLARVPPDLLLRTSVDALIFNSLTNSLSHLGDQSTPDLIRLAVTTTLQLIDLTTPSLFPSYDTGNKLPCVALKHGISLSQSDSLSIRFSRLSSLLSSSLLGTVLLHTPTFLQSIHLSTSESGPFMDSENMDINLIHVPKIPLTPQKQSFNPTLVVASQSLPPVLAALGIGGVCFLKGILPVLVGWLGLPLPVVPTKAEDVALHLASLSSLSVLFHTCIPQVGGWSTTIIHGLGQCWVGCLAIENKNEESVAEMKGLYILKKQLRNLAVQLARICPGVIKNEYAILLAFDKALFEGLVGGIP